MKEAILDGWTGGGGLEADIEISGFAGKTGQVHHTSFHEIFPEVFAGSHAACKYPKPHFV
jgi:hypothetical protein